MGLLTKAQVLALRARHRMDPSLEKMAIALCARINRLPKKPSTPYTALSLLKAYGSFQTGACLILKEGFYSSYTSVSMGIAKITIPLNEIWSIEKSREKFFKHHTGWEALLKDFDDGFDYWVFPLDDSKPWKAVMFLGAFQSSAFCPDSVSAIVPQIKDKLHIHFAHPKKKYQMSNLKFVQYEFGKRNIFTFKV